MIDCNNCPHLSITEEQQERIWRASKKMAMLPHMCAKYNQRVLHYPYSEPMIHPCQQCEEEKENTIIEYAYNQLKEFTNYELDPEYKKRLEEYYKKIEDDFQAEWPKKKIKWFFKKRRQQKLRSEITRRYSGPVFWLIEDILDDSLPSQGQDSEFFGKFVDVKDIAVGDEVVDKINSCGCTSFMLTPDEIKQLEFADKNDLMDECYQKIIEAGGCPSSVLNEEEYKITDDYIKEINRTLTYLNTILPPIKYIKVKSKFYKQLAKMHPSISSSEVEGIRAKLTGIPIVIDDEIKGDYEPVYGEETTK